MIQAYKGINKEKEALEASLKVLSASKATPKDSRERKDPIKAANESGTKDTKDDELGSGENVSVSDIFVPKFLLLLVDL